jgi:thymidine kinase
LEPNIKVICGSMFSGKTEELLRLLKRADYAKITYLLVKPATDTRGDIDRVTSHNKKSQDCVVANAANEVAAMAEGFDYIAIDEAQFFDSEIVNVVEELARRGKRIVISGLDMDYLGKPFGPMPQLLAIADEVVKLHAICTECGNQAQYSKRIINQNETILIGAKESYTALCRKHFYA